MEGLQPCVGLDCQYTVPGVGGGPGTLEEAGGTHPAQFSRTIPDWTTLP